MPYAKHPRPLECSIEKLFFPYVMVTSDACRPLLELFFLVVVVCFPDGSLWCVFLSLALTRSSKNTGGGTDVPVQQ